MKYTSAIIPSLAIAATAALLTIGTSVPAFSHGANIGQGQMGGNMGGHMMDSHMAGQGSMGRHMDHHMNGAPAMALDLGVDDVRNIIEGRLAMRGTDRLKVGKVAVIDDDTIVAEIVTVDDSLVIKLEFDRKTGAHHPIK